MPRSKSILSYPDCQRVFEQALLAEHGVKMTFDDPAVMRRFALRCHEFRRLDREQNKVLYPDPGATMHGRSAFDVISVREKFPVLEFGKIKSDHFVIEVMTEPRQP